MQIPIPLRSNPGAFKLQGEATVLNAYAQFEGPEAKAATILRSCAGLKRFGNDAAAPCRGMIHIEEDDVVYHVNGLNLYQKESDGTLTQMAIIPGNGPVHFARNDAEPPLTMVVAEGLAYEISEGSATFKKYDFTPAGVTFAGGRFLLWESSGRVWYSDINSSDVDGLSFFEAEGDPDGLTKVQGSINTVYLVGKRTTEIWQVTTDANSPFGRVGGAHMRFGSESPHSIREFNEGIVLIDNNSTVKFVTGFNDQTISTNEITRLINSEADKSAIVGFTYVQEQNHFYCLQGTGWTREYNATTQAWHKRQTLGREDWDSIYSVEAWGKKIFGSKTLGLFSELDDTIHTENGREMVFGFVTPIIHAHPQGLSFRSIDLDVETGGADIGREPMLMFDYSDDNGRTWSTERMVGLGNQGDYLKRARITGLGQCSEKGRMFRIRISDPVVRGVTSIAVDAAPVSL